MVRYKSHCRQTKTFYGVAFKYGEIKEVPGYIHDPRFVCLGEVRLPYKEVEIAPKKGAVKAERKKAEPKKLEVKPEVETKPSDRKVEEKKLEKKTTTKSEKFEPAKSAEKAETKKEEKKG